MRRSAGFTMVELVVVIVIIGILAAVAVPRMTGLGSFQSQAFFDQVTSGLRYAQKTATSHRRLVCATFTVSSVTLTIADTTGVTVCDQALSLPNGAASVQSGDTANAVFSAVPANLFFQPDGRATTDGAGTAVANVILTINGQAITVSGATGYVK